MRKCANPKSCQIHGKRPKKHIAPAASADAIRKAAGISTELRKRVEAFIVRPKRKPQVKKSVRQAIRELKLPPKVERALISIHSELKSAYAERVYTAETRLSEARLLLRRWRDTTKWPVYEIAEETDKFLEER